MNVDFRSEPACDGSESESDHDSESESESDHESESAVKKSLAKKPKCLPTRSVADVIKTIQDAVQTLEQGKGYESKGLCIQPGANAQGRAGSSFGFTVKHGGLIMLQPLSFSRTTGSLLCMDYDVRGSSTGNQHLLSFHLLSFHMLSFHLLSCYRSTCHHWDSTS